MSMVAMLDLRLWPWHPWSTMAKCDGEAFRDHPPVDLAQNAPQGLGDLQVELDRALTRGLDALVATP